MGAGGLSREGVEAGLTEKALSLGLTEAETAATIRSGIESGMGQKRDLSFLDRPAAPSPGAQARARAEGNGKAGGEPEEKSPPEIIPLPDLLAMDIPPPRWAVPGLLSEGLTLLAGKPKLGKSWFALNLALTVAAGGSALRKIPVEAGDVLYLALEDPARRMQSRSRKVLRGLGIDASGRLGFAMKWPREYDGGLKELRRWAEEADRPTMVVVDVWARFRPPYTAGGSQYDQDYQFASDLKRVADDFCCAVVAVHHTKKAPAEDVFDEISGTLGLNGAADATMVLTRARNANEATLHVTGREVEEGQVAVTFNPADCSWTHEGPEGERTAGRVRGKILEQFRSLTGSTYFPREMAEAIEESFDTTRRTMYRMAQDGVLEKVGNKYRWPGRIILPADPDGEVGFE